MSFKLKEKEEREEKDEAYTSRLIYFDIKPGSANKYPTRSQSPVTDVVTFSSHKLSAFISKKQPVTLTLHRLPG